MMEFCLSGLLASYILVVWVFETVACSVADFEFKFFCVWLPKVKFSSSICACIYKESKLLEYQQNMQ